MIGYCPSAGRIQPRHLLSFSTNSTAIAQVNRSLSPRVARVVRVSRAPAPSMYLFLSRSLFYSLFFFFLRSHGHARRPSRLAPFVLGSMPQLTPGIEKKKKRKSNGTRPGNCVHAGARATGARSDRFIAATADASHTGVSFLRFSPARASDHSLRT